MEININGLKGELKLSDSGIVYILTIPSKGISIVERSKSKDFLDLEKAKSKIINRVNNLLWHFPKV